MRRKIIAIGNSRGISIPGDMLDELNLAPEQVLFIHSRLIDTTGGAHGVRDIGLLLSALSRPRATFEGKDLYPDISHEAAALLESLVKNPPFIDGNKRTAIASAETDKAQVNYPVDYRNWTHTKSMVIQKGHPLFDAFGGIHHIYANKKALDALKSGKRSSPTIIPPLF